ncbi:spore coat protein YlbD, partial [Bacillus subtilis]|uniref:spore coat protein YlbD n=1 Tax=Bacillus subtilis TaxID=1423 RepID=UPI00257712EF
PQPQQASQALPETPQKNDFVSKILTPLKNIHLNQINQQINKITHSISSFQTLLNTFSPSPQNHSRPGSRHHPFSFPK